MSIYKRNMIGIKRGEYININLQKKTITPPSEIQTITPDEGYYGLSVVTVNPGSGEQLETYNGTVAISTSEEEPDTSDPNETKTIFAGTYKFIDNPDTSKVIKDDFYFKTIDVPDDYFNGYSGVCVSCYQSIEEGYYGDIWFVSDIDPDEDHCAYTDGAWRDYAGYDVRKILIAEDQTVYEAFYDWFIVNTKKLIYFTINDVEYQAEEGMTWMEWCESSYNTIEAYYNSDGVFIPTHSGVQFCVSEVSSTDMITSDRDYDTYTPN